jgi:hypothetical protein
MTAISQPSGTHIVAEPSSAPAAQVARRFAAVRLLGYSTVFWMAVAIAGQWAFMVFILVFYWPTSFGGNFSAWKINSILPKGYVAGDDTGNLLFAIHAVVGGLIAFAGVLQLLPQVRRRSLSFHRWNGRVFMLAIFGGSISGLLLNVWRESSTAAMTLNAFLILFCGVYAWYTARARRLADHRRWALRTFMVAGGVWFQRLGFFVWFIVSKGALGISDAATAVFMAVWPFGCYLLPLLVLEIYLRAADGGGIALKYTAAAMVAVSGALMAIGVVAVTGFLWGPLVVKLWSTPATKCVIGALAC